MSTMKTAEKLANTLKELLQFYSTYPNAVERQIECLERRIAEIQLDAFKAGMTKAAEIARTYLPPKNTMDSSPVPELIETACDRKDLSL